jgi:hypothetical protein
MHSRAWRYNATPKADTHLRAGVGMKQRFEALGVVFYTPMILNNPRNRINTCFFSSSTLANKQGRVSSWG